MSAFYHCPECDGTGDVCVMPHNTRDPDAYETCPRCEGRCTIPEEDIEFLETARPWSPSKRRWQGYRGNRLLPNDDPLEWLRKCRRAIPDRRTWHGVDASYHYQRAKFRAIDSLSHTCAGLHQADIRAMGAVNDVEGLL